MLREHVDLKPYNTLNVHARARYFCEPANLDELQAACALAKREQLPVLVLGEGSNVVLASEHIDRVVLRLKHQVVQVLAEDADSVLVKVGGGLKWQSFIEQCLANGWYGLENLSLIPGTVGAAPVQNIGAYGAEVADCIESVLVYHIDSGHVETLPAEQCGFGYRDSIFKRELKDKVIITNVIFRLQKHFQPTLGYRVLADYLQSHYPGQPLTAALVSQAVCDIRRSKLPDPNVLPNAGSFFKNPVVSSKTLASIQQLNSDVVFFPVDDKQVKLAAGWLIDKRGWKGRGVDGVFVHELQALVLVNKSAEVGSAVLNLAAQIQKDIQQSFGVSLEIEPVVI